MVSLSCPVWTSVDTKDTFKLQFSINTVSRSQGKSKRVHLWAHSGTALQRTALSVLRQDLQKLKQKAAQGRTDFQASKSSSVGADVLYRARDVLGTARTTLETLPTHCVNPWAVICVSEKLWQSVVQSARIKLSILELNILTPPRLPSWRPLFPWQKMLFLGVEA